MRSCYSGPRCCPAKVFAVLFLVLTCMTLGYYRGGKAKEREFRIAYDRNLEQERQSKVMLATCNDDVSSLIGSLSLHSKTVNAIMERSKKIGEQANEIERACKKNCDVLRGCRTESLNVSEGNCIKRREEDTKLKTTSDKSQILNGSRSKLVEWEGEAHEVLVCKLLTSVRRTYRQICGILPGCMLFSDQSLGRRWRKALADSVQQRPVKETSIMTRMLWRYNKTDPTDSRAIYFTTLEGGRATPTYFNRTGNPPLIVGREKTSRVVAATVWERLLVVQHYALCAYHHRYPDITVPSSFSWNGKSESSVVALHDLVQTPLVTFCMNCTETENTSDVVHMCSDVSQGDGFYGKRDFWATRSMVLPHPDVIREAESYRTAHAFPERRVLAVVLRNSVEDCLAHYGEPYGNHFLYLLANFPEEKSRLEGHVSNETMFQCSPTTAQLVHRITEVLEDKGLSDTEASFGAVYITASREIWEELRGLEEKPAWWNILSFRVGESTSIHDEFVDLVIAGQGDALLLSPFFAPNQYVLESFLLKHELQPKGRVWFF